jgi:hypothetical protein
MRLLTSLMAEFPRKQGRLISAYKYIFRRLLRVKALVGVCFMLRGKMNRRPRSREIEFYTSHAPAHQNLFLKIVNLERRLITDFGVYYYRL